MKLNELENLIKELRDQGAKDETEMDFILYHNGITNMNYIDEINRMIKAEEFAKRFPLFKDFILENKINDTTSTSNLGEKFLDTDLGTPIILYNSFKKEPIYYRKKYLNIPLVVFFIDEWHIFVKNFEKKHTKINVW